MRGRERGREGGRERVLAERWGCGTKQARESARALSLLAFSLFLARARARSLSVLAEGGGCGTKQEGVVARLLRMLAVGYVGDVECARPHRLAGAAEEHADYDNGEHD